MTANPTSPAGGGKKNYPVLLADGWEREEVVVIFSRRRVDVAAATPDDEFLGGFKIWILFSY